MSGLVVVGESPQVPDGWCNECGCGYDKEPSGEVELNDGTIVDCPSCKGTGEA